MATRKQLIEKWVKALNSGKYKQGQGKLHDSDDNTYCCLGVANKVCFSNKGGDKIGEEFLNAEFAAKLGLDMEAQEALAGLNDADDNDPAGPVPFAIIAGLIATSLR